MGAGEGEEEAHGLLDQGRVAPLGHEEEDAPGPHHGVHLPAEAEEVAFGPGLHLEEPGPGEVQLDAHLGLVGEAKGVRQGAQGHVDAPVLAPGGEAGGGLGLVRFHREGPVAGPKPEGHLALPLPEGEAESPGHEPHLPVGHPPVSRVEGFPGKLPHLQGLGGLGQGEGGEEEEEEGPHSSSKARRTASFLSSRRFS